MANLILAAPMTGWSAPLDEVPDPVFSGRMMGDGVAIDPVVGTLFAPCDGTVISAAKHAVTLRAANGAEILMHVGLETVSLGGRGFSGQVSQGTQVRTGDPVLHFNLEFLSAWVKSLISPVVVTNAQAFRIARRAVDSEVAAGDFLMEIVAVGRTDAAEPDQETLGGARRDVAVGTALGIHARPAALLSACAKRFQSEVTLERGDRRANAKSIASLLSLGLGHKDRLTVSARGDDADRAVAAVAELLASDFGETAAVVAPVAPVAVGQLDQDVIAAVRAAPGLTVGRVFRLSAAEIDVPEQGCGFENEAAAFKRALADVRSRIEHAARSGDRQRREILSAHLAILDDDGLHRAAQALIEKGKSAGYAWRAALHDVVAALKRSGNERLRERAADLKDLERQVLAALMPASPAPVLPDNAILVADEILPSELVALEAAKIAGFVTAGGGPTSHVAIIAAGMGIPALVGAGAAIGRAIDGAEVLLDADAGVLRLKPDAAALAAARAAVVARVQLRECAAVAARRECVTACGARIAIFANLGSGAEEAAAAVAAGAEGCGLLRTEFLFLDRETPPSEDEQRAQYQAIADALGGRPLLLRTFDIGGDKPVPYLSFPPEENPALGLRGVRAGIRWPDLLRSQLAAAMQVDPPCHIMLPMIASLWELKEVRATLDRLRSERRVAAPVPLGVMIETPAAALLADRLVREADFFSLGTNDLTQYALAMDRGNRDLAAQIDGLHPAVLRLAAMAAEAARNANKPVGVCGGLAADAAAVPILLGLGVGELSVPPPVIPMLKAEIRTLSLAECREVATTALSLESAAGVRALIASRWPTLQRGMP